MSCLLAQPWSWLLLVCGAIGLLCLVALMIGAVIAADRGLAARLPDRHPLDAWEEETRG